MNVTTNLQLSIHTVTGVRTSTIFPSFNRSSFALLHNSITSFSDINSHLRNYVITIHFITIHTVSISPSNSLSQHIQLIKQDEFLLKLDINSIESN